MQSVQVDEFIGRAADFHARELPDDQPDDRSVHLWWFETEIEAVVLGSTQSEVVIDVEKCRSSGVDIVRRRSGGGVVHLTPSGTAWLDVVLPAGHSLWDRDVTSSSFWLGEAWIEALSSLGVDGLHQHRDRLARSEISELICFAGRGPGEVFLDDGSKVVGISQRRTRSHSRFQCAVSLTWDPVRLLDLLNEPKPELTEVAKAGSSISVDRRQLITQVTAAVIERLTA